MILFRAVRADEGYSIHVNGWALAFIVAILTAFGFIVHVADRLTFG